METSGHTNRQNGCGTQMKGPVDTAQGTEKWTKQKTDTNRRRDETTNNEEETNREIGPSKRQTGGGREGRGTQWNKEKSEWREYGTQMNR